MSVYNGFGSRKEESQYNKTLFNLIYLLQVRVMKVFTGDGADDVKFGTMISKLYKNMVWLEKHKHLPPKFSYSVKDLA